MKCLGRGCTGSRLSSERERELQETRRLREEVQEGSCALLNLQACLATYRSERDVAVAASAAATSELEVAERDAASIAELLQAATNQRATERWGSLVIRLNSRKDLATLYALVDAARAQAAELTGELQRSRHVAQLQQRELEYHLATCEHVTRLQHEQLENERLEVQNLRQTAQAHECAIGELQESLSKEEENSSSTLPQEEAAASEADVIKDLLDNAKWQLQIEQARIKRLCGSQGCLLKPPLKYLCDDSFRKLTAVRDVVAREQAEYTRSGGSLVGRRCLQRSLNAINDFRAEALGIAPTLPQLPDDYFGSTSKFGLQALTKESRPAKYPTLLRSRFS